MKLPSERKFFPLEKVQKSIKQSTRKYFPKLRKSDCIQYLVHILLISIFITSGIAQANSPIDPRQIEVKNGHPILFADKKSILRAKSKTKILKNFISITKRNYIKVYPVSPSWNK